MGLSERDRKKLWGRSGNVCSYPDCRVVLARNGAGRVLGDEAHIKGEQPGAARYDAAQSPDERESYENRILLCPTHHVEIDSDEQRWTVARLYDAKAQHERDVERSQQFPELISDLRELVQRYDGPASGSVPLREVALVSGGDKILRVDAAKENGVDSGIDLRKGQRVEIHARGLISYDGGYNFVTPEGIICNALGLPQMVEGPSGAVGPFFWPHPQAYKTDGGWPGRIGSLIGWVGEERSNAFRIGSSREINAPADGRLYLAVNDARGTYGDNDGEFWVRIRLGPA